MTALDSTPRKSIPAGDVLARLFAALRTMAARATHTASTLLRQPSPTFRLDERLARDAGLDDAPRAPFRGDALSSRGLDADEVLEAVKRDCRRRTP